MKTNNKPTAERLFAIRKMTSITGVISLMIAFVLISSSCAKAPEVIPTKLAKVAASHTGCVTFEDEFWDGLHRFALAEKPFPSGGDIRPLFDVALSEGRLKELRESDRQRIVSVLVELYELLSLGTISTLSINEADHAKILETLTGLELGDRTTPEKNDLQNKIRAKFAEVEKIAKDAGATTDCPAYSPSQDSLAQQSNTYFTQWKAERHPAVYGALKALATAYQTCSAGIKPSMTSATANVEGISVIGTHSNGVGLKRVVSDTEALLKSHYYLNNYVKPPATCFDVKKNPMIYDYGGKPYATAETDSPLNFFVNAGSGTTALGIDCSGYIYSALAAGGLKVKEYGRLKAVSVSGINARMYMEPEANGLNCFSKVKFTSTSGIKPGDILASGGHVLMVVYLGSNPLGIDAITREADCNSTNIKASNFNFTVLQSAPIKGGMGISRIWAKDYFTGGEMTTAMVTHAINACKAKTRNTTIGTSASGANLIRHKGTAVCKDREVMLSYQSCVSNCSNVTTSNMR